MISYQYRQTRQSVQTNKTHPIDPENCTKQTYIPGDTVDEPRKAAVWRAQYIYDHPFPAKRPNTKKVCFRPDLKPWML